MELYRCFYEVPYTVEAFEEGWDDYVSDRLNKKIANWAKEMKAKYPKFRYRILSADSVGSPTPNERSPVYRDRIHTFIHILYEID